MIKRVITEAALQAFQRRLVQIADRTVTPIDGMYEDTDAGRALLEQYNARPIDEAYAIINTQTVYPMCLSCDHPIIDGKAHMGYCAEDRSRSTCSSHMRELTLAEAFNTPKCVTDDCYHRTMDDRPLCSCCHASLDHSKVEAPVLTHHDIDFAYLRQLSLAKEIVRMGPFLGRLIELGNPGGEDVHEDIRPGDELDPDDQEVDPATEASYNAWHHGGEGTWAV